MILTKSKTTKDIEKALFSKYDAITNHCAFEVKIGFSKSADQITKYVEIVDFIVYQNDGIFRCFEIKSSKADFLSGQRLSFYGDYNYLVVPKKLLQEIENCDLFKSLLWKGIGVLLVNIESAEIEVYRKPKKKIWNLGMKNILIESMVRSLARDAKKFYLKDMTVIC